MRKSIFHTHPHTYFPYRSVEALSMSVVGLQQGPSLVHLSFQVPGIGFGRGVMLQSVLPIEPMLQRVTHVFYTEKKFWAPFAKLVLYGMRERVSHIFVDSILTFIF